MRIDTENHDDYAVLTLRGDFDTFHCPALLREIDGHLARGVSHLILELRLVKFINSTALGAMIRAFKRCRAEGGELAIAHPSPFVRDVVAKVGIDQLIPVYDSAAEAARAIVRSINKKELAGQAPIVRQKVLVTFPDDATDETGSSGARPRQLGGTMANVDDRWATFTWNGERGGPGPDQASQLFLVGTALALKFQVTMIKRGFIVASGKVARVDQADDGAVRVTVELEQIAESDRAALGQFAADMAFLKQQLPG